jgi:hypothetical protein
MVKRVMQLTSILAVAAVTAGGGVALAQPTHHKAVAHKTAHPSASRAAAETTGADGDAVQSGDQTTPDSQSATSQEQPGSESVSDGPGGHEDESGAEVDHQFEGEE